LFLRATGGRTRELALDCGIAKGTIFRRRSDGSIRAIFRFRAARPVSSAAWPGKRRFKLIGGDNVSEILGARQQFVAFGQYKNGSHYVWPHGSPRDRRYGDLPSVTEAQIDQLSEKLKAARLLSRSWVRARGAGKVAAPKGDAPLRTVEGQAPPAPPAMCERVAALREAGKQINGNFAAGVPDDVMSVDKAILILRPIGAAATRPPHATDGPERGSGRRDAWKHNPARQPNEITVAPAAR